MCNLCIICNLNRSRAEFGLVLTVFETIDLIASANEQRHEISNNVVFATSKASDHPGHTRSLIKAFASRLNIL